MNILVVDDESNILLLYKEELFKLSKEKWIIKCAKTISDALEILETQSIDLVISDIKLKDENGCELVKLVKEKYADLPVILNSAFSCYKDDYSAWICDGYCVKSADLHELYTEIQRVLIKRSKLHA